MMKTDLKLDKIIAQYESFVIDVWGVLYNSAELLPGAKELIEKIEHHGKRYCILSNAPRPVYAMQKNLEGLGLKIKADNMITSGGFFREKIKEFAKETLFVMGESLNSDLLQGIEIKRVEKISDARHLITVSYTESRDEVESCAHFFEEAIDSDVVMICPNPDIVVYVKDKVRYTPGAYAELYKRLGGKVIYFGKPHSPIYDYLFEKHRFQKATTLMIGDSLETDIRGAHDYGFDSLMLLSGVHSAESDLESVFNSHNLRPTYLLNGLI